jgi:hypothetical protein
MWASGELESIWGFMAGSVDGIVACLDGLSEDDLNWSPLDDANSLYVLATHVMGSAEESVLGALCGQSVHRHREAEFEAQGATPGLIRTHWADLRERMAQCLANLPSEVLDSEVEHPRRGRMIAREILIIAARHAAEHFGHAELTRDLLQAAQKQSPGSAAVK